MAGWLAVAGGSAFASADPANTEMRGRANPPDYLALGNSIAQRFNPFVDARNGNSYVGYPEYLQTLIDIPHTNAGCYGETTSSFFDATAPDRGCRYLKQAGLVRAAYTGTQMEFMVDFIQKHSRLELITFALGANDILLTLEGCNFEPTCINNSLPGTFNTIASNLTYIFATIRGLGYNGQIIVPLYYDPFPTVYPSYGQLVAINNAILTQVAGYFGAQIVDVNAAFAAASASAGGDPCAAGLLIPLIGWNQWVTTAPNANCDAHPSAAGAQLIAETIRPLVPPEIGAWAKGSGSAP